MGRRPREAAIFRRISGFVLGTRPRPPSKLASVRKVEEGSARRTGVYTPVHEDLSAEPTHNFSTEVMYSL